jgi:hypothetical protein
MKRTPVSIGVVLVMLFAAGSALALDNIVNIHVNDANGYPASPYAVGTSVSIRGIITAEFTRPGVNYSRAYIQDSTGGINVYKTGTHTCFVVGDDVSAYGKIGFYCGTTEVVYDSFTVNSSGSALPETLVVTIPELKTTFQPDYKEPNEGRLIRINNVIIPGAGGKWASSMSYPITDGIDTDTLFVYNGSDCAVHPLIGLPIPTDTFDVVGILYQYDLTSPYTSGHQICPRYASDIIPPPCVIAGAPEEDSVTTTSAIIHWTTKIPSTSVLEYGPTACYGWIVEDANLVTKHSIPLTDLSPGTVYHCRVSSLSPEDTCASSDHVFVTVSDTPGEAHVYFSASVDTSYRKPPAPPADGNQPLQEKLIDRINAASHCIDFCSYSFSLSAVTDALIAAKNRGVQVRFIVEQDNSGSTEISRLVGAGIPVITSTYGGNHGQAQGWGINHNVFAIFDCEPCSAYIFDCEPDTADSDMTDDWVWTGSWNCSISGNDAANNVVAIRDRALALAYKMEFNEMWGSGTSTPDASKVRMGSRKLDDTPHKFTVAGMRMEQYMSPSDGTESKIMQAISTADSSIYFCSVGFGSDNNICNAMRAKWDSVLGFQVRGVCGQGLVPCCGSDWDPPAYVCPDDSLFIHHKCMIIDACRPDMDPTVITGSQDWTNAANTVNDENTLIIHSAVVANIYHQEFAARYREACGRDCPGCLGIAPTTPKLTATLETFPNPFNPGLTVRYMLTLPASVSLRVYDVSGRLVKRLQENHSELSGFHSIPWDGRDSSGRSVGSGVYVIRLDAGKDTRSQKVVLAR